MYFSKWINIIKIPIHDITWLCVISNQHNKNVCAYLWWYIFLSIWAGINIKDEDVCIKHFPWRTTLWYTLYYTLYGTHTFFANIFTKVRQCDWWHLKEIVCTYTLLYIQYIKYLKDITKKIVTLIMFCCISIYFIACEQ